MRENSFKTNINTCSIISEDKTELPAGKILFREHEEEEEEEEEEKNQ